ncbi:MAG: type II secretion system F family protein [Puniceicoccales bacterium]|jgi:type IV pilus assembly protein PilC|nr:type II secretion system F family protein [Puniceicoccales bacterium]
MQFRFLASNGEGKIVHGTMRARDEESARRKLLSENLKVELMQCIPCPSIQRGGNIFSRLRTIWRNRHFSRDWKAQFFQQMCALLGAGISIGQAISIIADGSGKASAERALCNGLLSKIYTGKSLSEAMAAFRGNFSYEEINIIRAAERVGQPQRAMAHLCEFSKTLSSIRRKVLSALLYPCIVLIAALCLLAILSTVVVPQFQAIFSMQMHRELPPLTRAVIALCTFFREHIWLFLLSPPGAFFCIKFLPKTWKYAFSIRNLPIFSSPLREYNTYLFTGVLAMLLSCNVQLQESLDIAKNVVFDRDLLKNLTHGIGRINHGEPISSALGGILSKFATGLILAGERSGSLAASLAEIAETYKNNLLSKLALLAAAVEPILIVALALIIGTIVIALFLPMVGILQGIDAY